MRRQGRGLRAHPAGAQGGRRCLGTAKGKDLHPRNGMELGPDELSLAPSLQLHGVVLSVHPFFLPHCFPLSLLSSLGAG